MLGRVEAEPPDPQCFRLKGTSSAEAGGFPSSLSPTTQAISRSEKRRVRLWHRGVINGKETDVGNNVREGSPLSC